MKLWLVHVSMGNEESVHILDSTLLADEGIDEEDYSPGDFRSFLLPGWEVSNIVEVTVDKGHAGRLPLGYELRAVH
jgi:hypothetical protein